MPDTARSAALPSRRPGSVMPSPPPLRPAVGATTGAPQLRTLRPAPPSSAPTPSPTWPDALAGSGGSSPAPPTWPPPPPTWPPGGVSGGSSPTVYITASPAAPSPGGGARTAACPPATYAQIRKLVWAVLSAPTGPAASAGDAVAAGALATSAPACMACLTAMADAPSSGAESAMPLASIELCTGNSAPLSPCAARTRGLKHCAARAHYRRRPAAPQSCSPARAAAHCAVRERRV
jgi:hypothetical protein